MAHTVFDNHGTRNGGGSFNLSRYTGPENDRRRYQVTIFGETDNCGYRAAWMNMSYQDLKWLAAAIAAELNL